MPDSMWVPPGSGPLLDSSRQIRICRKEVINPPSHCAVSRESRRFASVEPGESGHLRVCVPRVMPL